MKRRIISFCMAMLMLFSTVPIDSFTAHAAEADGMYFIDESLWLAEGEEPAVPAVETGEWQKTEETQEVPYVCPVAEHTHVYNCSTDAEGKYSCGGHEHGLDCYAKLYDHEEHSHSEACGADCTIAEHVHGEECAHTLGELICGLEEHKHVTDGCAADCAIAEHSHSTDPATVKQVKWVVALKDDAADTYAPATGSIPVSFYVTTLEEAQNPNGSYAEYKKSYWGTRNGTDDTRAYSIANISQHEQWGTLQDQYAIRAQMVESEVTKFVGQWPEGSLDNFSKFTGTIRVGGKNYSGEEYEVQWVTVCWRNNGSGWQNCNCLGYFDSTKYEHLHVDGILTKKVTVQPEPEPEDPTPDNPDPTPVPVPGAINLRKQLSQASDRDETFNFKLYTLGLTSGYDPTDTPVGDPIDMRATVAKGQTVAAIKPLESVQLGFGYYKLVEEPHDRYSQSKTFIGTDSQNDTGALYINIATDGTVKYSRSHASGYTTADYAGIENKAIPTTEVKVTKVWNDNNNQDGKRPETAEIHLLKNSSHMGESYAAVLGVNAVDTAIIDYGVDANGNWTATWKGLPATDFYGNKISYHVEEKMPDEYVGVYTVSISGDADTGFTMTNTHVPEKATVSVRKVWDDNNNRDGIRPASVSVQLKKDGIAYGQPQILSESNKWSYDFTDLPKYEGGQLINYSFAELVYDNGQQAWVEGVPEGYTLSTATDEHTGQILLTNSHKPAESSITITKTWDDNNNQDHLRDSISLRIYAGSNPLKDANGNDIVLTVYNDERHEFSSVNPVSGTQTPVTLSADVAISGNTWTITVSGLLRNVSGSAQTPITYHIVEDVVPGYTMTDGNNNAIEYVTASGSNGELFAAFTNRHVPEKTSVLVSKVWDDSNNQDGKRPASITVELKNGSTVAASATLSAANNWSYTFENLDKYADGEEIKYTVDEPSVPAGYTFAVTGNAASGFTITNSYSPQLFKLTVTKKWEDLNNNDNSRPYAVAVILLKNGQQYDQVAKLGNGRDDNSLSYTWTDLPRYENGTIITYTVEEVGYYENAQAENYVEQLPAGYSVDHFYSTQAGHENMFSAEQQNDPDTVYALVINSYTPLSTSLNIKKTWVDDNDREGLRPESLTFQLWKTTTDPASIVGAVDINGYYTGVPSETDGIWTKMDKVTATMTKGEQGSWFDVTVNNLPKYENGNLLYYTVTETVPEAYTASYSLDSVNDVVHVTNSHKVNFIDVSVSKEWDDGDNNDGKRPDSVTVKLYANGVYVGDNPTATLSGSAVLSKQADGSWSSHTWPGLYEYYQGSRVVYSVVEEPVAGYTTSYPAASKDANGNQNLTVLNKHEPEKMSISVTKVWDDNNNQDGIRPASVDASLYGPDGEKLDTVTVTAQDNWTATFNTKVTKYADGKEIVYTVKEDLGTDAYYYVDNDVDKDGAATVVNGHATLTNKHVPETVSVTARKVWNDDNNRDNKRPASVQFHLTTDKGHLGPEYMATLSDSAVNTTVPDSNIVYGKDEQGNWTVTWKNLPKYKSGVPIKYVVEEAAVAGYSTSYSRDNDGIITVTNARTIDTTNVTVRKLWQDDNDRDGLRPEEVTVQLMMHGENGTTVPVKDASGNNLTATLSAAGNWYHTFTGLPLNEGGKPIQYSVVETTSSDSYTTTYSNNSGVLEITNTHQLETTQLSITKVWDDNNNQDGIRPTGPIILRLYADSVALKDAEGNNVVVRVNPNAANENERIVIPYQPKSNAADVHISAAVTVDANDSSKWAIEISGLLKHVSGSEKDPIHYSVVEEPVVGYTSTVANVKDADNNELINQLLLTNKHEPEKISIPVTKLWNDANNQDGKRPASVTVKLYKNNTEDKTLTLSAANNWTGSFDELDKYAGGQPISYTVGEAQVPEGYTSAVTGDAASGFTVTNSYTPETVDVTARKVWKDDDNNDKNRPGSVQFHLTTNMGHMGEKYVATLSDSAEDTTVSGTNVVIDYGKDTQGNWTVTWTNLPKYRDGTMINYVVEEAPSDALVNAGYSASYSRDENGLITVTNTRDIYKTNVTVRKLWHDDNDRDGLRPEEVTVKLMQPGENNTTVSVKDANGNELTAKLSATGNWYHTFLDLPLYEDGNPIQYSVVEEAVDNYTAKYNNNFGVLEITNTHAPLKTKLNITKVWADNNNQDNIRPNHITMTLYADGSPMKDANGNDVTISISANEYGSLNAVIPAQPKSNSSFPFEIVPSASVDPSDSNRWLITVEGLLQHSINSEQGDILYSVVEHAVNGYTASVSETTSISSTSDTGSVDVVQALTLTNTHVPEKMSISVTKIWDDAYNQDGKRPNSLIVNLYGPGSETSLDTVTLTAQGGWTATFTKKVDKYAGGQPIRYIVKENVVPTGYSFVDTDGDEADAATVDKGHATLTNKHVPETVSVTARKVWNDDSNRDNIRPTNVEFHLTTYKGHMGEDYKATLSDSAVNTTVPGTNVAIVYGKDTQGNWTVTWTNLPKYREGVELNYVVQETLSAELAQGKYSADYSRDENGLITVTNTRTIDTTSVTVRKLWKDDNNRDGLRPEEVTVQLMQPGENNTTVPVMDANGNELSATLSAAGNWHHSFEGLPLNEGGNPIQYSVVESNVNNYTASYEQEFGVLEVINSHAPLTTTLSITKVWDDKDNQDGKRPEDITLTLYADGSPMEAKNGDYVKLKVDATGARFLSQPQSGSSFPIELGATVAVQDHNTWLITLSGLLQHSSGSQQKDITYNVVEEAVDGYTSTVSVVSQSGLEHQSEALLVTNRHVPEKTSVSVTKVWDDNDNQDGKRPASVTVKLYKDGTEDKTLTLSADNNWSGSFENLDKYQNGQLISYTVSETQVPEGYSSSCEQEMDSEGNPLNSWKITNTHDPETFNFTVHKVWDDYNDNDAKRPAAVAVKLMKNGQQYGEVAKLGNGSNDVPLSHTWTNLPRYENGTIVTYTIEEVGCYENADDAEYIHALPAGYSVDHFYSTQAGHENMFSAEQMADLNAKPQVVHALAVNKYTPERTSLNIQKRWTDDNDREGLRPESITFQLWKATKNSINAAENNSNDIPATYTKVPSAENGWTKMEGYTVTMTKGEQGRWFDYTVNDLPKYENGNLLYYTVTETVPNGYTANYSLDTVRDIVLVENVHEISYVDVDVRKVWNDNNNQDGIRPENVTVKLYANGVFVENNTGSAESPNGALTLNEANNWSASWNRLYKFYQGQEILYTVVEEAVDGYTASYEQEKDSEGKYINRWKITNTHIPETTSVSVYKVWNDDNNRDNAQPAELLVALLANGVDTQKRLTLNAENLGMGSFTNLPKKEKGEEIKYTVEEVAYKLKPDSELQNLVNGEIPPEALSGLFSDNRPFAYGYTASYEQETDSEGKYINRWKITNTHVPEKVIVKANKVWDDDNNRDKLRPDSVYLHLIQNNQHMGTDYRHELSESNGWSTQWTDLPKYYAGERILYTVAEEIASSHSGVEGQSEDSTSRAISDYQASYEQAKDDLYHWTVTNRHHIATTELTVTNVWDDDANRDRLRTDELTITLMKRVAVSTAADDAASQYSYEPVRDANDNPVTAKLNSQNNWVFSWLDLPKNENGQPIVYSVAELPEHVPSGYSARVESDEHVPGHFVVTNTHIPETTSVKVSKIWDDDDDRDGIRPEGLIVQLYVDGVALVGATAVLDEYVDWSYTWQSSADMPLYFNRSSAQDNHSDKPTQVEYTVAEIGYIKNGVEVLKPLKDYDNDDPNVLVQGKNYEITLTNKHAVSKTSIEVSKVWDDAEDNDRIRPASVEVTLKSATGADYGTVTLSDANQWKHVWTDLYVNQGGVAIEYLVEEAPVEGYTASYAKTGNSIVVTNTHEPAAEQFVIEKIWRDNNNAEGYRPAYVNILLYKNGVAEDGYIVLSKENGWKQAIDLPVYENGEEITWTIKEAKVPRYYSASYDQENLTVTNTIQSKLVAKTGDYKNPLLWLLGLGGCMAGAGTMIVSDRKKKRRDTK